MNEACFLFDFLANQNFCGAIANSRICRVFVKLDYFSLARLYQQRNVIKDVLVDRGEKHRYITM